MDQSALRINIQSCSVTVTPSSNTISMGAVESTESETSGRAGSFPTCALQTMLSILVAAEKHVKTKRERRDAIAKSLGAFSTRTGYVNVPHEGRSEVKFVKKENQLEFVLIIQVAEWPEDDEQEGSKPLNVGYPGHEWDDPQDFQPWYTFLIKRAEDTLMIEGDIEKDPQRVSICGVHIGEPKCAKSLFQNDSFGELEPLFKQLLADMTGLNEPEFVTAVFEMIELRQLDRILAWHRGLVQFASSQMGPARATPAVSVSTTTTTTTPTPTTPASGEVVVPTATPQADNYDNNNNDYQPQWITMRRRLRELRRRNMKEGDVVSIDSAAEERAM